MRVWKEYRLDEIALVVDCEHKTAPIVDGSEYYSVRTSDISRGKIDYQNCNRVDKNTYIKWTNRAIPEPGDIILAREAPVGEVGIVKKGYKVCLGQRTVLIKTQSPEVDNIYLLYYLINPTNKNELIEMSAGSVVAHLNMKDIRAYEIRIPPLPEQRAIASILSSLDDKIDLMHRQNATLEAMAEALFRQWFVVEVGEEWADATLEEHTEAFRGLSYKGSGLTEKGLGLPMHNLNSVYEGGGYKYEGIKFYHGEYRERHLISPGDIIVTNTEQGHEFRLIGFPAIVPDDFGAKGLFSQHIYKLAPLPTTYLSKPFIYYLLMAASVREQIISATNGSTVNMLAIDGLQRPEFKLPPEEKVIEFTAIVDGYWKKKSINHKQIRTLTALRDTLLPKLMSGELRVKI